MECKVNSSQLSSYLVNFFMFMIDHQKRQSNLKSWKDKQKIVVLQTTERKEPKKTSFSTLWANGKLIVEILGQLDQIILIQLMVFRVFFKFLSSQSFLKSRRLWFQRTHTSGFSPFWKLNTGKRISWHFGPWNSDIRGMNQAAIILCKPCYSKEDKAIFQLYNHINKKWSDIFYLFWWFCWSYKPSMLIWHILEGLDQQMEINSAW